MGYVGDGARAVDLWVDSVWHRLPILSPWVREVGYGRARGCDTMIFAWAEAPVTAGPVTYPFNGQTDVPRAFDGRREAPPLPAPPGGWPSGYPIIVYARDVEITSHDLLDGNKVPVPHIWIAPEHPAARGILGREHILYAYRPLEPATVYTVQLEGLREGWPIRLVWTFATR